MTSPEPLTNPEMEMEMRPRLAPHVYLRWDRHAGATMVIGPERGLVLDAIAAEVISLCDGERSLADVLALLAQRHPEADPSKVTADVTALLDALWRRRLLVRDGAPGREPTAQ